MNALSSEAGAQVRGVTGGKVTLSGTQSRILVAAVASSIVYLSLFTSGRGHEDA